MAGKEPGGSKFVQFGTILEVKDAVSLEDGRFILTTVGIRRFKVISKGEQVCNIALIVIFCPRGQE